jgi:RHS repeat-associated protein
MPLLAAARLNDPIAHTSMLAMIGKVGTGLLVGAAIGFVAGVAATALVAGTVLSGGLVGMLAVAVLSGLMMHAVGANPIIENASNAVGDMLNDIWPPTVEGKILQGSPNVFINGLSAARAVAQGNDNQVTCSRHPPNPPQYLAEGSESVFINGFPAHRKSERTTCNGKTSDASKNVFIGGNSMQAREISSEMPWWLQYASLALGVALAVCTRDWKSIPAKLGCLGLNLVINMGVEMAISTAFGKPVHAATGAKLLDGTDDTDFALPARVPLQWVRRYNSLDTRDGLFGPGWSVPVSVQLRINQGGEHPNRFIEEQGREIPFDAVEEGQSQWNLSEGWRLGRTLGGFYVLEGPDGLFREFGPAPDDQPHTLPLLRIEDLNGNYIALHYDEGGRLSELADCAGRLYRCDYDARHPGRLAAIHMHATGDDEATEHSQEAQELTLVRYTYDVQGRLIGVADRAGDQVRSFTWHDSGPGAGLMASHILPTGLACHYEWAAFPDHPRVVRHRTSDEQSWCAEYRVGEEGGETVVTDHLGRVQRWSWNARAQITAHTDALGRRTTLEWNETGLLSACTQVNSGVWAYAYDDHGNLISETDPLGQTRSTTWRQDMPLPLSETDALGRVRRYEYDETGNLIAEEGPEGRTEIGLDRHGQMISLTDARGGISYWTWHASGQAATHKDCSGRLTRYVYDDTGALLAQTDPAGNTTTYRLDEYGRLDRLTLADGSTRHWQWKAGGMLDGETDALGHFTRYAWNTRGQLAHRADALGHRVEFEYDRAGRLSMLFNENRQAYQFDYDAADQLKAQTGLDGLRSEYTLDALGLPIEVRQAAGSEDETTLSFERDLLGRLTAKTTPETITRYAYDAANQLVHVERHARKENAPLDALDFAYDLSGNLVEETSTQYRLDGKPLESPRTRTLRHAHDALGNRTATELPQGHTLNYLYYGNGHLHQINLDGEAISDIERDATHREISRSQGNLLSHFQRDALGRITARRAFFGREAWAMPEPTIEASAFPAPGDATLRRMGRREDGDVVLKGFAYDANGELERRIDPVIGEQRYAYDALGRITAAQPDPGARVPGERFDWDAASNPREPGWPEPPRDNRITRWGDRRYAYDARGRLTTKRIGPHTEIRLRWNSENQLVASETRRTGTRQNTRYDYDAIGRRIAKHDVFGTTFFTWEGMHLIQEERGPTVATHVYEPGSYEPLARIEHHVDPVLQARNPNDPPKPVACVYYLHNNINGAPEEMTDARGALIWQARYAIWGSTVTEHGYREHRPAPSGFSAQSPLPQNLRMQGQYADAETGLCYNTFRYYDPDIGRFISQDPIGLAGGMNLYQYAPNPLAWIDPWGLSACWNSGAKRWRDSKTGRFASTPRINTPYGHAIQGNTKNALAARTKVENGADLYRTGTLGKSQTSEAQFWALENPRTPGYAPRHGIPQENIENANSVEAGKLKLGTNYITREVPGVGSNLGGGIEVVTEESGVILNYFVTK